MADVVRGISRCVRGAAKEDMLLLGARLLIVVNVMSEEKIPCDQIMTPLFLLDNDAETLGLALDVKIFVIHYQRYFGKKTGILCNWTPEVYQLIVPWCYHLQ